MKCPYCNEELDVLPRVFKSLEFYSLKTATVHTNCCNKFVTIKTIQSFEVEKYDGDSIKDDWGVAIK